MAISSVYLDLNALIAPPINDKKREVLIKNEFWLFDKNSGFDSIAEKWQQSAVKPMHT